jgi:HK97 family phage portal protein
VTLFRPERRAVLAGAGNGTTFADGSIPPPWWMGNVNASGQSVDGSNSLAIPAVWDCISLVSDYVAGLPVSLQAADPAGGFQTMPVPDLLRDPWPEWTPYEWKFAMQASLMFGGNAYGHMSDFDGAGYPRMIQPVDATKVIVRRAKDKPVEYLFDRVRIPTQEVFHLRNFVLPGALVGFSPIEVHAMTLGIQLAAEKFGAEFFAADGHPTAVLQSDLPVDEKQANKIKARILAKLSGSREPIILGAGTKWVPIQIAPNESQFLETMKFGVNQVCRIFHVPAEMVGGAADGSSVTYANIESRDLTFQTYGVMPWTERWSQSLTALIPGTNQVRFDLDARLRADMVARYQAYAVGLRAGFLSADEPRNKEGMADIPDDLGKQFLWPPYSNKFQATEADQTIVGEPEGTPPPAAA